VLKTAKDLVDNAKSLVAGAASNQEHLMSAANTITETITRMANCVKLGATALGSHQPDAQVTTSLLVSYLCIVQGFLYCCNQHCPSACTTVIAEVYVQKTFYKAMVFAAV